MSVGALGIRREPDLAESSVYHSREVRGVTHGLRGSSPGTPPYPGTAEDISKLGRSEEGVGSPGEPYVVEAMPRLNASPSVG